MSSLENIIFSNLVYNEVYSRRVLPYIKEEYFSDRADKVVFQLIHGYVDKYNRLPTKETLAIDLSNLDEVQENVFTTAVQTIENLVVDEDTSLDWLMEQTEEYCQDRAIYNGLMESVAIATDKSGDKTKGSIPEILTNALAVSFDTSIGHDYIDDAIERFEFYHLRAKKIGFDVDYFNKITDGGFEPGTLNIILAGTYVGKSLVMCHMAAHNLSQGLNVLYISMELSEKKVSQRIDANLLNVSMNELKNLTQEQYLEKIGKIKSKGCGKLIVKQYPTAGAGTGQFRHLLQELRLKKKFKPDILYIDYLNICMSARLKYGSNVNSYTYIKAIAEELRGLAVEFDVPIVSATQTTRSGFMSSDVDLTDTSESFGLPATADFMMALIVTEELHAMNQIMVKQLKNRYMDTDQYKRFVIGIDRPKMRLFDTEQSSQEDILDESAGQKKKPPDFKHQKPDKKFDKGKFSGFK